MACQHLAPGVVGLDSPQVALPLAGAAALLLAAVVVLGRGGLRGAPLGLAVFLAGQGTGDLVSLYSSAVLREATGALDVTLILALGLTTLGAFAVSGLGLLWFLLDFPRRRPWPDQRPLLLAGAVVVALVTASMVLVLDRFTRAARAGATVGDPLFMASILMLGALGTGGHLLAMLTMPLRFREAREHPWERASMAWFGATFSVYPAVGYGPIFLVLARFGDSGSFAQFAPGLVTVPLAAILWLWATTTGPREATRTARNLALLVLGVLALGMLAARLASLAPANAFGQWWGPAAEVVVAALVLDGVVRQRLLEVALEEPPARQVEAPPPA